MSPFAWIAGRLRCFTGSHQRSGSKARQPNGADHYESICVYCGVTMVRLSKRNWVVKSKL